MALKLKFIKINSLDKLLKAKLFINTSEVISTKKISTPLS